MVSKVQAALQGQVLPLFRTRADVSSWRAVREYAASAREGLSELEGAAAEEDPRVVLPVVRRALRSAIAVQQRADDSNGEIGDVVGGLLGLHAGLCTTELPLGKLVDWLVGFEFDRSWWHDFSLDVVEYADALGPGGLERYQQRVLERQAAWRATLGDATAREDDAWVAHVRFAAERALQRVAVARADPELILQRYVGDGTRADRWLTAARALVEIDAINEAIDAAGRGAFVGGGPHAVQAGTLWADLLKEHRPEAELAARREVFDRYPSSSTAAALHRAAVRDGSWPDLEPDVLAALRPLPRDLVMLLLHTLDDPGRAFQAAVAQQLPHAAWNDDVWDRLVDEQLAADPGSVLPVLEEQVGVLLQHADAEHYRAAAARLVVLRRAARAAGRPDLADQVITTLRQRYRNRPRLQAEFDRADLPPLVRIP